MYQKGREKAGQGAINVWGEGERAQMSRRKESGEREGGGPDSQPA